MLTESTQKSAETIPEKKICESCGEEFSCGAQIGKCWCFEVDLNAEALAELIGNYNRCLCENCLSSARDL